MDFESALCEIKKNAGIQFDPVFAEGFIKLMEENRKNNSNGKFLISSSPVDY